MYTQALTEELAVVGKIDPASYSSGTNTDITGIDMSFFRRLLFVVQTGALTATGTVDFKVRGCATSGGTYADVNAANTKITQITASSNIALLEVRAETLTQYNAAAGTAYRYFGGRLANGTAACLTSVLVLGSVKRNLVSGGANIAAVTSVNVF